MEMYVDWECPACGLTDQTTPAKANRYHNCPRMGGLTTPLVRKGVKAKHEAVMREDYVGDELVRLDDQGRPVMAIKTTRDNGQDVTVFAPSVVVKGMANG